MDPYHKAQKIVQAFKRDKTLVLGTDDPVVNSYIDHILGGMPAWPDLDDAGRAEYVEMAKGQTRH